MEATQFDHFKPEYTDAICFHCQQTAEKLEDYAVAVRYPDEISDMTNEDVIETYNIAKEIKEYVLKRIDLRDTTIKTKNNSD